MSTVYKITLEGDKWIVKSHVTNPNHSFLGRVFEHTFVNFVAECDTMADAQLIVSAIS